MDMSLSKDERSILDACRVRLTEGASAFGNLLSEMLASKQPAVHACLLLEEAGAAGLGLDTAAQMAASLWRMKAEPLALGLQRLSGGWGPAAAPLRIQAGALTGEVVPVITPPAATRVVFAYTGSDGSTDVGLVDLRHPALSARAVVSASREPQSRIEVRSLPLSDIGTEARPGLLFDLASLSMSALMVGIARRAMAVAIEHARHRQIFGRALGSLQVTRHLAADMLISIEAAALATREAFWLVDRTGEPGSCASQAKLLANAAAISTCRTAQQMLGAAGFIQGSEAHALYRRALSASLVFGTTSDHALRVADAVTGDGREPRITAPCL